MPIAKPVDSSLIRSADNTVDCITNILPHFILGLPTFSDNQERNDRDHRDAYRHGFKYLVKSGL